MPEISTSIKGTMIHQLVVKWMVAGGVVLMVLGLLVTALCQKKIA
jgi:hypothetical protein